MIDLPLLFTPDGSGLRVIHDDGTVQRVDLQTGAASDDGSVPYTTIDGSSANGQYLALHNFDDSAVVIWDLDSGASVASLSDTEIGYALAISSDGRFLAYTASDTGELVVWNLVAGQEVARLDDFAGGSDLVGTRAFDFSPDSEMLYYPTTAGNLRLLDTSSWMEYRRLHGAPGTLSDVTMSQDQGLLAAAGESGTVVVWDLASGTVAQRIDEAGAVAKLSISPDGQTLLAGDERGEMTLWRLANFDDTLGWLQANRALIPLTCADLLQARVIASANLCPIITPAAD